MSDRTSSTSKDVPSVSCSWAVVVGDEGPWPEGVATLDPGAVTPADLADLSVSVRPGQAWVIVGEQGEHRPLLEALGQSPGSTVIHSTRDQVLAHLIEHAANRHRIVEDRLVDAMREITVLRRELNSALSALSPQHPVLGLMPSMTLDEFRAERHPAVPLRPADPGALMTSRQQPALCDDEGLAIAAEVAELRNELAQIQNTRLMRWSAAPRKLYRSLRRIS